MAKAKGAGRAKSGKSSSVDIRKIREDIGRHYGLQSVGRDYFAKLLGASSGSVILWEKGNAPSDKFAPKIAALAKKIAASDFKDIPLPPKRGRQPKAGKVAGRGRRAGPRKAARVRAPSGNGRNGLTAPELARALLDFAVESGNPKPLIEAVRALLAE